MSKETETLLRESLKTAVPLWIEELKGKPFDDIVERARACSDTVAAKGDNILFKSKKKGGDRRGV